MVKKQRAEMKVSGKNLGSVKFILFIAFIVQIYTPIKALASTETSMTPPPRASDFSYMKSLGSSGHGVWCFQNTGNSATTGESLLSNQNVDASLLNLMFQDISTQKAFVKNKYKHQAFAVDSKSKKTILQTYYNCEVFKPAIAAASEQTHKADINTFKGLEAIAIKVGTFSEEDPRKLLTEQEWLHTYRGVGVMHSVGIGFGTALAIACPDGINDIVITNYHGIKKKKIHN